MKLQIQQARYLSSPPYVLLELVLDGRSALISPDQSPTLSQMGYISLGSEFDDLVPEINVPADAADGREAMRLRGFTDDPRVKQLFDQYISDINDSAAAQLDGRELPIPG